MGSGQGSPRSRRRKRRALVLVLFAIALSAGGALAWKLWLPRPQKDSKNLDLLYVALADFNAGRFEQANAVLDRRAAETRPTSLDWMLRARVASAQGRLEDALKSLDRIPDSSPIAAQARLLAGQVELARHHARAADQALRRALELDPSHIQTYRELAYLYALQRRKAECVDVFLALDQHFEMGYVLAFAWGQNDCEIWDPSEAIKVLVLMLEADPDDRDSRLALATNYRLQTQFDRAEETLRPLGDADPDARAIRVRMAFDCGDFTAAKQLVQDGPAGYPGFDTFRGRLAQYEGDPKRAAAYFRDAIRRDPHDRDALQGLGVALRQLGDPTFEKYLRLAYLHDQLRRTIVDSANTLQTDRKIFDKLAELCESIDRLVQARIWYRIAIQRDPLDTQAQQGLARLNGTNPERQTPPDPARSKKE